MKRRYALHPMEFAIGETEQFYSEMAAKGWFLEKRGAWFSRFRRGEPAAMRYRVELADLRFLDPYYGLPEEQISVYEECGWKYVTGHGRRPGGQLCPGILDPSPSAAVLGAPGDCAGAMCPAGFCSL